MKRLAEAQISILCLTWCVAAYAQSTLTDAEIDFADSIKFYDAKTWGFILFWGGIGALVRFQRDHKSGEIDFSLKSIVSVLVSSMPAAFIAFAGMEMASEWTRRLPSSSVVGAVIMVCAYFSSRTLDLAFGWIESKVKRNAEKDS